MAITGYSRWGVLRLSFTVVGAALAPTQVMVHAAEPPRATVFIGGVGHRYASLADPAASAGLLRLAQIGLYQHANGNARLTATQRVALRATWRLDPGDRKTVGEVGGASIGDSGYLALFGGQYPAAINMNTLTNSGDGTGSYRAVVGEAHPGHVYGGYTTAADLTVMEQQICTAMAHGVANVAVVMTPNGGLEDLDDAFATAPYWANVRAAAHFGGGIALDVPPTYGTLRGARYQAFVASMLAWVRHAGLRSSLIVSPYAAASDAASHTGSCGYDPAFMHNTLSLAEFLTIKQALPTEWVVEDYGVGPNCGTGNDVVMGDAPGSLNAVAVALARPDWVSATDTHASRQQRQCDADRK